MTLDAAAILALLPHRPPLLLVHAFTAAADGTSGIGQVSLDLDAPLWRGQGGRELFAELVLEGAAQSLGLLLASQAGAAPAGERHLLLGFGDTAFSAGAPVAALEVAVALQSRVGPMCRGRFTATAAGAPVATGELTVMQG